MKIVYRQQSVNLLYTKSNGKTGKKALGAIFLLSDSDKLLRLMLLYLNGKQPKSISTWSSRIVSTLSALIEETGISSLPKTSIEWQIFIKNWYGLTLTTDKLNGAIKTRVGTWNKNIKPFLEFMQQRDAIPINTIIPKMKSVAQAVNSSSFETNIIGETKPELVKLDNYISKLIMPISLSRTDGEYFDEIKFDLESKRNKLLDVLTKYWNTIKDHYEYGDKLISAVDESYIQTRIKEDKLYDYVLPFPGKKIPPRRTHISKPNSISGLSNYLYILKNMHTMHSASLIKKNKCLPKESITATFKKYAFNPLPNAGIENIQLIPTSDRINWCLGVINTRDVSYIMALLILLNPKFTTESLLFSKIVNKEGKTLLKMNEIGETFEINKQRAKSKKTSQLNGLSYDILNTLIEMSKEHRIKINNKDVRESLFISPNITSSKFTIPAEARVYSWLTGYTTKTSKQMTLADYFPSMFKVGLNQGTLSHSKIRNTEGVLEWFKTGSIRCVSRVLGNSNKVALEHYIPKELISMWNTRQVRRFQNLLIVSAMIDEENLVKVVDFNSLEEIHNFISETIKTNDKRGNNPVINYLRDNTKNTKHYNKASGDLITTISKNSLAVLYTYEKLAIKSNVSAKTLSRVDQKTSISPLSIISLSSHLSNILIDHPDTKLRESHSEAVELSDKYMNTVKWDELFIAREIIC